MEASYIIFLQWFFVEFDLLAVLQIHLFIFTFFGNITIGYFL